MIRLIETHVGEIIAVIFVLVIGFTVINALLTRRFFRRQFRKSIESLSLPALMDEITTNRRKYQTLTGEMMDSLTDKQLPDALYYHLLAEARQRNRPVEDMVLGWTGHKRTAGLIVIAQESFRMSGFLLCYQYTPRLTDGAVAEAYQEIGAKHCARTVKKASECVAAHLGSAVPHTVHAQLRTLDEALRWYSKTEKLESLTARYIRENRQMFLQD